ncbi:MAG: hypothetical protein F6K19_43255 [Cyanothece sp. SIO1E1]|nr:hypothetical protein [Cyanothece sp. SIO1E1]
MSKTANLLTVLSVLVFLGQGRLLANLSNPNPGTNLWQQRCMGHAKSYGFLLAAAALPCMDSLSVSAIQNEPAADQRVFIEPLNADFPIPSLVGTASRLWATYYYVPQVSSIAGGYPLLNLSGYRLGPELSHRDWCRAAVQGTVQTTDHQGQPQTYNYAGRGNTQQVDCSHYYPRFTTTGQVRFKISQGPYGEGVAGFNLVPYRSIAVDRNVIPIGSVIYIPAARGQIITLPSGDRAIHDGYFYAADVGSAIHGRHIDVFLGVAQQNPFPFVGSAEKATFTAYLVDDSRIKTILESMHSR